MNSHYQQQERQLKDSSTVVRAGSSPSGKQTDTRRQKGTDRDNNRQYQSTQPQLESESETHGERELQRQTPPVTEISSESYSESTNRLTSAFSRRLIGLLDLRCLTNRCRTEQPVALSCVTPATALHLTATPYHRTATPSPTPDSQCTNIGRMRMPTISRYALTWNLTMPGATASSVPCIIYLN